jgi:hypothetical protein
MSGQNHIRQNHAAPPLMVLPASILSLLRMILSGHDSVGLRRLRTKALRLGALAPLRWFNCICSVHTLNGLRRNTSQVTNRNTAM